MSRKHFVVKKITHNTKRQTKTIYAKLKFAFIKNSPFIFSNLSFQTTIKPFFMKNHKIFSFVTKIFKPINKKKSEPFTRIRTLKLYFILTFKPKSNHRRFIAVNRLFIITFIWMLCYIHSLGFKVKFTNKGSTSYFSTF